ncbi:UNVERIFIED_CONTAM: hypothetical protein Sradi_0907100 [Sesamum radiatum]|uniref:Retrotransposon gag domain-containing protein n=1 Tax=Sesamum radiatum TaxID=300843 RepID=A0AAW2V496_SESRA
MMVMTTYTKLKGMWNEFASYSKVPNCTSGAKYDLLREREEEKLHQFFMGLDDALSGTVRSQILNLDPLPTMNKSYAMITKKERHRKMMRGRDTQIEEIAKAVTTPGKWEGI